MSALAFTDWAVICDFSGCSAQERTDTLSLRDGTAGGVRKVLSRRGWAVAIPNGSGRRRLDYCPAHLPREASDDTQEEV